MKKIYAIMGAIIILITTIWVISATVVTAPDTVSTQGISSIADSAPTVPSVPTGVGIVPSRGIGTQTTRNPCGPVWKIVANRTVSGKKILVDLSHAERISIDKVTSSYLDLKKNPRIFDWQAWADDMRGQGYTVDLFTVGPITESSLLNYDLLIIAQPDTTSKGPAYFTSDEMAVIGNFVHRGNGLLLMGQQFMGGQTEKEYIADYTGSYSYDLVQNKLLKGLGLPMQFYSGKKGSDPFDLMVSDDNTTQIYRSNADIWITSSNVPLGPAVELAVFQFGAFHANSIIPNGASEIAKGDESVYTTPKNLKYSPVLQPKGSLPVLMSSANLDCGLVVAYGDPSAWQTRYLWGDVYTNFSEQLVAKSLIKALTGSKNLCEPVNNSVAGCPGYTGTPTKGTCDECLGQCSSKYTTMDQRYAWSQCRNDCNRLYPNCGSTGTPIPTPSRTPSTCDECLVQCSATYTTMDQRYAWSQCRDNCNSWYTDCNSVVTQTKVNTGSDRTPVITSAVTPIVTSVVTSPSQTRGIYIPTTSYNFFTFNIPIETRAVQTVSTVFIRPPIIR